MQGLQPNFTTDGIRNSMSSNHSGDNAKKRIFSFILEQRRQPNDNVYNVIL